MPCILVYRGLDRHYSHTASALVVELSSLLLLTFSLVQRREMSYFQEKSPNVVAGNRTRILSTLKPFQSHSTIRSPGCRATHVCIYIHYIHVLERVKMSLFEVLMLSSILASATRTLRIRGRVPSRQIPSGGRSFPCAVSYNQLFMLRLTRVTWDAPPSPRPPRAPPPRPLGRSR